MSNVSAGHELLARIAIRNAADLRWGDVPPLFSKPLGRGFVVGKCAIDVHLVSRGKEIRRAEIGQRIVGSRLRVARENTHQPHAVGVLG